MYNFNMLCSCVSRDIFGIKDEDAGWEINKSDKYEVRKYANFVSPLYSIYPGLKIDFEVYSNVMNRYKESHTDLFSGFRWRCKYIDITHSCVDFLKQDNPDYLVIDSYAAAYNYRMLKDGTVITDMDVNIIDYLTSNNIIPPTIKWFQYEDIPYQQVDEMVAGFAKNIKAVFRPEQIILIEIKAADLYLNHGSVYSFPQSDLLNKKMDNYFNILCKYFSDCNIIHANAMMIGNSAHKWGTFPVHFVNEVYFDYYLKKIDMMVEKVQDVEQRMMDLDDVFNKKISEKYFHIFYDALRNRELSCLKRMSDSKYSRLRTAHGTYVCYDEEHNTLIHERNAGYRHFSISAIGKDTQLMLYFVVEGKIFYIKKLKEDVKVELSVEPVCLNVCRDETGDISICSDSKFLSARLNGEFEWMDWKKEWEQFSLEKF